MFYKFLKSSLADNKAKLLTYFQVIKMTLYIRKMYLNISALPPYVYVVAVCAGIPQSLYAQLLHELFEDSLLQ